MKEYVDGIAVDEKVRLQASYACVKFQFFLCTVFASADSTLFCLIVGAIYWYFCIFAKHFVIALPNLLASFSQFCPGRPILQLFHAIAFETSTNFNACSCIVGRFPVASSPQQHKVVRATQCH